MYETIDIKVMATDMDGTFLDFKGQYNQQRFLDSFCKMKEQGIRFVCISGNQYDQLISFFPGLEHEIEVLSENGALIFEKGKLIQKSPIDKTLCFKLLSYLHD